MANYNSGADWNGQDGNVTTVGSATSTSYYGAFDMGGNVWEWNEAEPIAGFRGLRGGSWFSNAILLQSSSPNNSNPAYENFDVGFRVASIPEPVGSSLVLMALAMYGCRRRRR